MTAWQVGLFFLAAGVWLAGVIAGDRRITGVALLLLAVAILLRGVRDRHRDGPGEPPPHE